jgi:hypothetical protein
MSKRKRKEPWDACMRVERVDGGVALVVIVDGIKIAKRGHPGTPQACTWISLEPGWHVLDAGEGAIMIEHSDVPVH